MDRYAAGELDKPATHQITGRAKGPIVHKSRISGSGLLPPDQGVTLAARYDLNSPASSSRQCPPSTRGQAEKSLRTTPDWQDAAPARRSANYVTHQVHINAERSTSTGIRLSDTTRVRTWHKARQVAEGLNSRPDRSISATVIFAISPLAEGANVPRLLLTSEFASPINSLDLRSVETTYSRSA
jgi:hypothetical protein